MINGHLAHDSIVDRSLDVTFNRDPLKIREGLYFGLLFPVRISSLAVRP